MTNIPRLYIDAALNAAQLVPVSEGQGKYLTRVMRLPEGAIVRAFNGRQGEYRCTLHVDGKRAGLVPVEQIRPQKDALDLTLMFAPLKKTRTDFVVEKAAELGARMICPVITEFTQTSRVRADRLQALTIEAAEQTERLDIPEVFEASSLSHALAAWDRIKPLYFCDEASTSKPMLDCLKGEQSTAAGLLIGPEGGFSSREREMLGALEFVIPITLGPRILRAETAVVSALTLWQSVVGDWQEAPYLPET